MEARGHLSLICARSPCRVFSRFQYEIKCFIPDIGNCDDNYDNKYVDDRINNDSSGHIDN